MTPNERAEEMFQQGGTPGEIKAFFLFHLAAVAAEERERCVKVCDQIAERRLMQTKVAGSRIDYFCGLQARACGRAILARDEGDEQ